VILNPNEPYHVTPPPTRVLRISSAAIDPKAAKGNQASLLVLDKSQKTEFVIATLVAGSVPHTHLDLFFVGAKEVTFKVQGQAKIHLTGYTTYLEGEPGGELDSEEEAVAEAEFKAALSKAQKANTQVVGKQTTTLIEELKGEEESDEDAEAGTPEAIQKAMKDLGEGDDEEDDEEDDIPPFFGTAAGTTPAVTQTPTPTSPAQGKKKKKDKKGKPQQQEAKQQQQQKKQPQQQQQKGGQQEGGKKKKRKRGKQPQQSGSGNGPKGGSGSGSGSGSGGGGGGGGKKQNQGKNKP